MNILAMWTMTNDKDKDKDMNIMLKRIVTCLLLMFTMTWIKTKTWILCTRGLEHLGHDIDKDKDMYFAQEELAVGSRT